MNILVLNGSPKGGRSNTLKVTNAFLDGLNAGNGGRVEIVPVYAARIEHCRGCFACWTKTPGRCVIPDDMAGLIEKYVGADVVIWSFPLYYFGMPSKMKAFLDRLLPTNLPFMTVNGDGTSGHPARYDLSNQRHVLISTCGFYSRKNNYDALLRQFEILSKGRFAKILCPEGELLRVPQLSARVDEYLSQVRKAGEEFALNGEFSSDTQKKLDELLYPPETFVEMANASWEIQEPSRNSQPEEERSYRFVRQMAAVYNPRGYSGDVVLELYFTDLDKTYQLLLGKEKCTVSTDDFTPYTTRIETSFELWQRISEGKINGAEAMMKKQYRVLGSFDTMLKMDDYFGTQKPAAETPVPSGAAKTNMSLLLLPWIILWALLPVNAVWGAAAGIAACSVLSLLGLRFRLTVYDRIGGVLVSAFGLAALFGADQTAVVCVSYLVFGALWLVSCAAKIPLTAYYSCNGYGGEKAFGNPLFLKTNRILTAAWGALFLLVAIGSYFLMNSPVSGYTGLLNSAAPALMGAFTAWFAKWYPAKVARG